MTVTCVDAGHRVEVAGGSCLLACLFVFLPDRARLYLDVPLLGSVKADPTEQANCRRRH